MKQPIKTSKRLPRGLKLIKDLDELRVLSLFPKNKVKKLGEEITRKLFFDEKILVLKDIQNYIVFMAVKNLK